MISMILRAFVIFILFAANVHAQKDSIYRINKNTTGRGRHFIASAINIFYGYNIPLTNTRVDKTGDHRITLTVNFDKELWSFL